MTGPCVRKAPLFLKLLMVETEPRIHVFTRIDGSCLLVGRQECNHG